ncbi:MAG: hypothetical protein JW937_09060 [Candidatus Omnitrophica bacterium]|nr:hypothetical protein [Candidatus Omnitrophota bacterium]
MAEAKSVGRYWQNFWMPADHWKGYQRSDSFDPDFVNLETAFVSAKAVDAKKAFSHPYYGLLTEEKCEFLRINGVPTAIGRNVNVDSMTNRAFEEFVYIPDNRADTRVYYFFEDTGLLSREEKPKDRQLDILLGELGLLRVGMDQRHAEKAWGKTEEVERAVTNDDLGRKFLSETWIYRDKDSGEILRKIFFCNGFASHWEE